MASKAQSHAVVPFCDFCCFVLGWNPELKAEPDGRPPESTEFLILEQWVPTSGKAPADDLLVKYGNIPVLDHLVGYSSNGPSRYRQYGPLFAESLPHGVPYPSDTSSVGI